MKVTAAVASGATAPIVRLLDAGSAPSRPDEVARARAFAVPLLVGRELPTGEVTLAHWVTVGEGEEDLIFEYLNLLVSRPEVARQLGDRHAPETGPAPGMGPRRDREREHERRNRPESAPAASRPALP